MPAAFPKLTEYSLGVEVRKPGVERPFAREFRTTEAEGVAAERRSSYVVGPHDYD